MDYIIRLLFYTFLLVSFLLVLPLYAIVFCLRGMLDGIVLYAKRFQSAYSRFKKADQQ